MTLREMIYNDIKGHKSTIVAKKKKIKKTVLGDTGVDNECANEDYLFCRFHYL